SSPTIGFNNFGMDSARLIGNHNSLVPESAHISQSRRGSDTSTIRLEMKPSVQTRDVIPTCRNTVCSCSKPEP
ncbi:2307_t:CDS:2, partial [Racocetra persica]